jgi:hypothetical protein
MSSQSDGGQVAQLPPLATDKLEEPSRHASGTRKEIVNGNDDNGDNGGDACDEQDPLVPLLSQSPLPSTLQWLTSQRRPNTRRHSSTLKQTIHLPLYNPRYNDDSTSSDDEEKEQESEDSSSSIPTLAKGKRRRSVESLSAAISLSSSSWCHQSVMRAKGLTSSRRVGADAMIGNHVTVLTGPYINQIGLVTSSKDGYCVVNVPGVDLPIQKRPVDLTITKIDATTPLTSLPPPSLLPSMTRRRGSNDNSKDVPRASNHKRRRASPSTDHINTNDNDNKESDNNGMIVKGKSGKNLWYPPSPWKYTSRPINNANDMLHQHVMIIGIDHQGTIGVVDNIVKGYCMVRVDGEAELLRKKPFSLRVLERASAPTSSLTPIKGMTNKTVRHDSSNDTIATENIVGTQTSVQQCDSPIVVGSRVQIIRGIGYIGVIGTVEQIIDNQCHILLPDVKEPIKKSCNSVKVVLTNIRINSENTSDDITYDATTKAKFASSSSPVLITKARHWSSILPRGSDYTAHRERALSLLGHRVRVLRGSQVNQVGRTIKTSGDKCIVQFDGTKKLVRKFSNTLVALSDTDSDNDGDSNGNGNGNNNDATKDRDSSGDDDDVSLLVRKQNLLRLKSSSTRNSHTSTNNRGNDQTVMQATSTTSTESMKDTTLDTMPTSNVDGMEATVESARKMVRLGPESDLGPFLQPYAGMEVPLISSDLEMFDNQTYTVQLPDGTLFKHLRYSQFTLVDATTMAAEAAATNEPSFSIMDTSLTTVVPPSTSALQTEAITSLPLITETTMKAAKPANHSSSQLTVTSPSTMTVKKLSHSKSSYVMPIFPSTYRLARQSATLSTCTTLLRFIQSTEQVVAAVKRVRQETQSKMARGARTKLALLPKANVDVFGEEDDEVVAKRIKLWKPYNMGNDGTYWGDWARVDYDGNLIEAGKKKRGTWVVHGKGRRVWQNG